MTVRQRSLAPMLQSSDLQRTIDWYESVLGFAALAAKTIGAGSSATASR